jgi:uncharacterized protein
VSGAALVDAGPLIAYYEKRDSRHEAAVAGFRRASGRILTTWPVVAEAAHMLGRASMEAKLRLLGRVADGSLELASLDRQDAPRLMELMSKYADRRMDLADASLVRVAERDGIDTVYTFDVKDFRVYRAEGIGALRVLP